MPSRSSRGQREERQFYIASALCRKRRATSSTCSKLLGQRQHLTDIAAPEEIRVIEHVIKLVNDETLLDLIIFTDLISILLEARFRKAAKEPHHGNVGPAVADRTGRIDQRDAQLAVLINARQRIARPQIAMQQRRLGMAGNEVVQPRDDRLDSPDFFGVQQILLTCHFQLKSQSIDGIEFDPIIAPSVGLKRGAEMIINLKSISRTRINPMQGRQIVAQSLPRRIRGIIAWRRLDHGHQQHRRAFKSNARQGLGHKHGPRRSERPQTVGLFLKEIQIVSPIGLGDEVSAIIKRQAHHLMNASAGKIGCRGYFVANIDLFKSALDRGGNIHAPHDTPC